MIALTGGAGGKGTWGKPGSEMFGDLECNDAHDPNYDSDQQGSANRKLNTVLLHLTELEFRLAGN